MTLDSKIEALLFHKAEPFTIKGLGEIFEARDEEIISALQTLEVKLKERGIRLMRKDDSVFLGTAPEMGPLIEKITKEEYTKDLGRAALETLAIILYHAPVTKSEIDYIRGVNSSFILRALLVRGLAEREQNQKDQRSFLYKPTFDLLAHLGVTKQTELPEYNAVIKEIETFKKLYEQPQHAEEGKKD